MGQKFRKFIGHFYKLGIKFAGFYDISYSDRNYNQAGQCIWSYVIPLDGQVCFRIGAVRPLDHPGGICLYGFSLWLHPPINLPNPYPEQCLFRWIVLRIVIWHIFGRMEKLSEITLPLTKNWLYEEAGDFKFKKKIQSKQMTFSFFLPVTCSDR